MVMTALTLEQRKQLYSRELAEHTLSQWDATRREQHTAGKTHGLQRNGTTSKSLDKERRRGVADRTPLRARIPAVRTNENNIQVAENGPNLIAALETWHI
ncbi:hypothetical protein Moror_228 [Moniliophthora roreri MCA 2997]|uniref:Uncharacterized protein n=1 Tax=Moniliophthora roreri (strain MCA 2997) TaxID=1381753 RepID=V2XGZ2_MONRO|nr:hypothetical protein Moror_228 [Moniliophthora roreri MCA 2997]